MNCGWHLGTGFFRSAEVEGHVEYVGGDIKEGKDNLAENKMAGFSVNWHFKF